MGDSDATDADNRMGAKIDRGPGAMNPEKSELDPPTPRELGLIEDMKTWKSVGDIRDGQLMLAPRDRRVEIIIRRLNKRGRWTPEVIGSYYGKRREEFALVSARAIYWADKNDRKGREIR